MALEIMLHKYCGIGNCTVSRIDYPEGVLAEIKMRTENCEVWPYNEQSNKSALLEEIADNIKLCRSNDEMITYIEDILLEFQSWISLYSLCPHKLDAIANTVVRDTPEYFFRRWYVAFVSFVQKFAVLLAKRGINILEIQNRCGLQVIDSLDINELWMYFGTRERADYYLTRLNVSYNGKKHNALDKVFSTDKARVLIKEMVNAGFMKPCGDLYQWEGTAALLGYFIARSSEFLTLRPSNNRIPWKKYEGLIANLSLMKATARQAVNDYQNKDLNKPEGYEVIEQIIASIPG